MSRRILLIALFIAFAGCQRASRFPAPIGKAGSESKAEAKAVWGWAINDSPPRDLPIRYIAENRPEWKSLGAYWNLTPHPAAGIRTIHIAQSPLGIAVSFALLDAEESITIKVPRGLADPTPLIPDCNPPTFGKWRLGKKIFFDSVLLAGSSKFSCADCHQPGHGFAEPSKTSLDGPRNTLSLFNVAYNREQFWDGRVRDLEEVLVHSLEDELDAGSSRTKALAHHRWGGMAKRMDQSDEYRYQFKVVFGVERVTQDDIAKALATYLRTILVGDSLYDRALAKAVETNAPEVAGEHFNAALDDVTVKSLARLAPFAKADRGAMAAALDRGQRAFRSSGCVMCHPPGLFTNQGYANVLIDDSGSSQAMAGKETGRFTALPIGLKDASMRGAYRVPTLRNLLYTAPYFHTGSRADLREAIDHFRKHLEDSPLLATPLREALAGAPRDGAVHPPLFSVDDRDAIHLFLLSLDGKPVDPIVASRP